MKITTKPSGSRLASITTGVVLSAALSIGAASVAIPAAHAQNAPAASEIVVAQDNTPQSSPQTPVVKKALTATPSAPGTLTIHAKPRTSVLVRSQDAASGSKSKKKTVPAVTAKKVTTNKNGDAIVKGLTPGINYTITSGAARISATPEATVLPATSLRVVTTEIEGQLELRWNHETSAAQGAVGFTVTAEPQGAPTGSDVQISAETTANSIVLTDLDLDSKYEFAVTSHNTISSGTPTKAVMTKSLRELIGTAAPVFEAPEVTPSAPQVITTPSNQGTSAPTPSGPSTRTIYVCPTGFIEEGSVCTKRTPYTYTTLDYTYHSENYNVTVEKPGTPYAADVAQSQGTPCPWGGSLNAAGDLCLTANITVTETRTRQVKDATPAGFTDTGSQWTKKDAAPAGFTDNGSEWISITGKESQVVPA